MGPPTVGYWITSQTNIVRSKANGKEAATCGHSIALSHSTWCSLSPLGFTCSHISVGLSPLLERLLDHHCLDLRTTLARIGLPNNHVSITCAVPSTTTATAAAASTVVGASASSRDCRRRW